MKTVIILIWTQQLFQTWVILCTKVSPLIQIICLVSTIIGIYLQLTIIQDYFYMKINSKDKKLKRDIHLFKSLESEEHKK